ncbi:MAG: hypothetical protein CL878_07150 [Dehalococcoidia bacterium]|nr:hypothetical protein [Dehalococcoidia bacterium]
MTTDLASAIFSSQQLAAFARDGYFVVRGLFDAAELRELVATCDDMHAMGEIPGRFHALSPDEASDPLLPVRPSSAVPRWPTFGPREWIPSPMRLQRGPRGRGQDYLIRLPMSIG